ncbi:MAG: hypothetical protein R3F60_05320 [bacterium]
MDAWPTERLPDLESWRSPFLHLARRWTPTASARDRPDGRPRGPPAGAGRHRRLRRRGGGLPGAQGHPRDHPAPLQSLPADAAAARPPAPAGGVRRRRGGAARRRHPRPRPARRRRASRADAPLHRAEARAARLPGRGPCRPEGRALRGPQALGSLEVSAQERPRRRAGGRLRLPLLHLSHEGMAPVPQALLYGLNYAVCFVLIYMLGATLATKQPALTASRLSMALEEGESHESFAYLVRAIWRSQFLSFVGNIGGAALFSLLIAAGYGAWRGVPLVEASEAAALGAKLDPVGSASLFYAAIAGVLLSAAGFFAGYVDNAVVFHRLGERVRRGAGIFGAVPAGWRPRLAHRLDQDLGGLSGNVALGFLLGSAGALGVILGLPIDIRHIAFASSHGMLSLVYGGPAGPGVVTIFAGVLLIGLVNFVVSFALTLGAAVAARQVEGAAWRPALRSLWRLAAARPLLFFVPWSRTRPRRAWRTTPLEPGAARRGPPRRRFTCLRAGRG